MVQFRVFDYSICKTHIIYQKNLRLDPLSLGDWAELKTDLPNSEHKTILFGNREVTL
jgi:hypothetical protein